MDFKLLTPSPCISCVGPCCSFLPMTSLCVDCAGDLEFASKFLNFPYFEWVFFLVGEWRLYYLCDCRFFDSETTLCRVHNQPEQPLICQNYSPIKCGYQRIFEFSEGEEFMRLDQARLDLFRSLTKFDNDGQIIARPYWYELWDHFAELKITSQVRIEHPDDGLSGSGQQSKSFRFPAPTPNTQAGLDFYRHRLSFLGVELELSRHGWCVVVNIGSNPESIALR